jgi:hypothetical protein
MAPTTQMYAPPPAKKNGCLKWGLIGVLGVIVLGLIAAAASTNRSKTTAASSASTIAVLATLPVAPETFGANSATTDPTTAETTASTVPATVAAIGGDPAEIAEVTPDGKCTSDDFGLISWPVLITNGSSKPSNYSVEGVIEQDGVKVGDLIAFVQNVSAGGKAKDKMTSLDTIKGPFTCRIVKVDRTAAS